MRSCEMLILFACSAQASNGNSGTLHTSTRDVKVFDRAAKVRLQEHEDLDGTTLARPGCLILPHLGFIPPAPRRSPHSQFPVAHRVPCVSLPTARWSCLGRVGSFRSRFRGYADKEGDQRTESDFEPLPEAGSGETVQMLSFYKFHSQPSSVERVNELVEAIDLRLRPLGVFGTVYVATEGVNAQLAVPLSQLDLLRVRLGDIEELTDSEGTGAAGAPHLNCGECVAASTRPFKKLVVKARPQVITDGLGKTLDWQQAGTVLASKEWDTALEAAGALLLDCRNDYESDAGHFMKGTPLSTSHLEKAEPLGTQYFSESWDVLRKRLADVPRETPIMTYCTGGIRCVKVNAFLEQELGFENTTRLKDGIVGYLRDKRREQDASGSSAENADNAIGAWHGSNFVFDRRSVAAEAGSSLDVAVHPSVYRFDDNKAPLPDLIYRPPQGASSQRTLELVVDAVRAGFRAFDTACQPKHYSEFGVGAGLEEVLQEKGLKREDVWLQTTFTSVRDQDPLDIPFDETADLGAQVRQSLAVSLRNLKTTYLDVLMLHSPLATMNDTLRVWRAMEDIHDQERVR